MTSRKFSALAERQTSYRSVVVAPVVIIDFTASADIAKLLESVLRLITPAERPVVHRAVGRDVDAVALPEDVVASSILLGDLDLDVVELKFVYIRKSEFAVNPDFRFSLFSFSLVSSLSVLDQDDRPAVEIVS